MVDLGISIRRTIEHFEVDKNLVLKIILVIRNYSLLKPWSINHPPKFSSTSNLSRLLLLLFFGDDNLVFFFFNISLHWYQGKFANILIENYCIPKK